MCASSSSGVTSLQVANLHGDLVATLDSTGITSYSETDEYGNLPTQSTSPRYGWLGSHQRSTDAVGGITLMGARLYNAATGLFFSPDPVLGGNITSYTYPQDPINLGDPDGRGLCIMNFGWCGHDAVRHTGALVHIKDHIWHKITAGKHAIPSWLVYKAIFFGHRVWEEGRGDGYAVYRFTVWDWNCTGSSCKRGSNHTQIRFVVDCLDGRADSGFLVSMYCETASGHTCPNWIAELGPYAGPPGPQYY
jgi:RHS repeat-associated protein